MYTTIDGEPIDGTVVSRRQKTMTVENENGRFLCWLQGEPEVINHCPTLPAKRAKAGRESMAVRAIAPDGSFEDYSSITSAASDLHVSASVIQKNFKNETVVSKEIVKGYQFFKLDIGK